MEDVIEERVIKVNITKRREYYKKRYHDLYKKTGEQRDLYNEKNKQLMNKKYTEDEAWRQRKKEREALRYYDTDKYKESTIRYIRHLWT